jgi:hypothetical protein
LVRLADICYKKQKYLNVNKVKPSTAARRERHDLDSAFAEASKGSSTSAPPGDPLFPAEETIGAVQPVLQQQ